MEADFGVIPTAAIAQQAAARAAASAEGARRSVEYAAEKLRAAKVVRSNASVSRRVVHSGNHARAAAAVKRELAEAAKAFAKAAASTMTTRRQRCSRRTHTDAIRVNVARSLATCHAARAERARLSVKALAAALVAAPASGDTGDAETRGSEMKSAHSISVKAHRVEAARRVAANAEVNAVAASRLAKDFGVAFSRMGGGASTVADEVARIQFQLDRTCHLLLEAAHDMQIRCDAVHSLQRTSTMVVDAYDDLEIYLRSLIDEARDAESQHRVHPHLLQELELVLRDLASKLAERQRLAAGQCSTVEHRLVLRLISS